VNHELPREDAAPGHGPDTVDVSVILLTYNHERFIAQAIESVLKQTTDASVEILISEDCSTDRTREIVVEHHQRHPDVIRLFLSESNLNDNTVYLRAYEAARGEFITYLDGDDYWLPEKLERQLRQFRERPELVMAYHDAIALKDGDVEVPFELTTYRGMQHLLLYHPAHSGAVMFRRDALPRLPDWFAWQDYIDWPLAVLLAEQGPVGYLDEPLSVYRQHAEGLFIGASYRQQREWDLRTVLQFQEHLGSTYRRETALAVATARYRLAKGCVQEGDHRRAARLTLRSLRDQPTHPWLSASSRLKVLTHALLPGPYERLRSRLHRGAASRAGS
jgi:glycosyltransferase involved in cell wall biosynthesis